MKNLSLVLAAAGCLFAVQAATVTSASADDMRAIGMSRHDHCHMVRTVMHGPHGKRVDVRRICR